MMNTICRQHSHCLRSFLQTYADVIHEVKLRTQTVWDLWTGQLD